MAQQIDKYPQVTNLGGIHILNPPEPHAHVTNLNGVQRLEMLAAGGCRNIPDFFKLEVGGPPDLEFPHLTGTFYLQRVDWEQQQMGKFRPLGMWVGNQLDAPWPLFLESQVTYDWVLYFGRIHIELGPYSDGFQASKTWWLVAEAGLRAGKDFSCFGAEYIYSFKRPLIADENNVTGLDSPGQLQMFDALQPNVFVYHPQDGGFPEDAIGGNQTLTVRPWYP